MNSEDFDYKDSFFFETLESNTKQSISSTDIDRIEDFREFNDLNKIGFAIISYDYINEIEKIGVRSSEFPRSTVLIPRSVNYSPDFKKTSFEIKDIIMPSKVSFIKNVEKIKEEIKRGEAFQIVISHRVSFKLEGSKFSMFLEMRERNPSQFNFYFKRGKFTAFGTSPEKLVSISDNLVSTNPIAGTYFLTDDFKDSFLLNSEKDLAEHNMLVDLARNDIGRISKIGSVRVQEYLKVKKFRGIAHLVSTVSGEPLSGLSRVKIHDSLFPAGTVSGAPKLRAMEIIDRLEEYPRGPYAGSVGILRPESWDFAINIRSVYCIGDQCYAQAGAGIVLDSVPELEYNETINKLRSSIGGIVI